MALLYEDLTLLSVITHVAIVITIGSFLTGLFICKTIWTKQSTVGIPAHMFMAGILCTFLWLTYGIYIKDSTQVLVNLVGVTTQSSYLLFYYFMTHNKRLIRKQFAILVVLIMLVQTFTWNQNQANFVFFSGLFASGSSLFFVASPLLSIKQVVNTKSTECLPFPFIFCSFIVGSLWFTYGFLIDDYFIMTPNAIGSSVSAFQLVLFLIYPAKKIPVKIKSPLHKPLMKHSSNDVGSHDV